MLNTTTKNKKSMLKLFRGESNIHDIPSDITVDDGGFNVDNDAVDERAITISSKDIDLNVISRMHLIKMKRLFPDLDYATLCR